MTHPNQKASEEDILNAIAEVGPRRQDIADKVGISLRALQKRLANMKEAGKLNFDLSVKYEGPGAGREIVSVKTQLDEFGEIKSQNVSEKLFQGDHEPIIDAPIVRQSTLLGRSGDIMGQWNIRVPRKTQEAEIALLEGLKQSLTPVPPRAQITDERVSHLANEIVFSDGHLGSMFDCSTETQLQDQYDMLCRAFEHMIKTAPNAETAILTILGDWFHFDNLLPETPRSRHTLFANGNYRDMIEIGVKLMRKLIDWLLMTHKNVEVVICEGNHDQASALWLRVLLMTLYEKESRVKFADSETPFYAIPFGRTFLGYHHGHIKGLKDTKDLALYFAAEFRKLWGETEFTFLKTGHLHHIHEKEEHGVLIQQQPTLAGKDFYAKHHGYRSMEAATCTTYAKDFGEVGTNRVTREML